MAEPAKPAVVAFDFPGLISNIDQRDLPPGAAEDQFNLTSIEIGEMQVRQGVREVIFEA